MKITGVERNIEISISLKDLSNYNQTLKRVIENMFTTNDRIILTKFQKEINDVLYKVVEW